MSRWSIIKRSNCHASGRISRCPPFADSSLYKLITSATGLLISSVDAYRRTWATLSGEKRKEPSALTMSDQTSSILPTWFSSLTFARKSVLYVYSTAQPHHYISTSISSELKCVLHVYFRLLHCARPLSKPTRTRQQIGSLCTILPKCQLEL